MHNKTIGLDSIPSNLAIDLADELSDEVIGGVIPQINIPQFTMPQINIPQFTMPQINIPQINIPQITMPQWYLQQREGFNFMTDAVRTPDRIETLSSLLPGQPQKEIARSQPGFRWDLLK